MSAITILLSRHNIVDFHYLLSRFQGHIGRNTVLYSTCVEWKRYISDSYSNIESEDFYFIFKGFEVSVLRDVVDVCVKQNLPGDDGERYVMCKLSEFFNIRL